jgi:putative ABC transport system substrate-binding protein
MPVVGYLSGGTPETLKNFAAAFGQGLGEVGYVVGRNVTIDYRWAADRNDRLPEMAAELVQNHVAVIFAQAPPSARAAKAATSTIPIVFTIGGDPIQYGLVASLSRPGGNVTGVSLVASMLVAKRVDLLRGLLPGTAAVALLVNPTSANAAADTKELEAAARRLGLQFRVLNATSERDIDAAFVSLAQRRADMLVVGVDVFLTDHRDQIVALAARQALPAIYPFREFVVAGGLISYGTRVIDANHQAGIYAGRILRGEAPADLPVVEPTKFELVVNLKTAKALGLNVPPTLLALADEVIE